MKGASPKTIQVTLPAGSFGRPSLTVREEWSVKGVAYRFTRAVSAQNVALFALILVSATLLTGQGAYTAVRRRRLEFGVLRALGWPARRIAWLVELEMLALGGAVGMVTTLVGVLLVLLFHLEIAAWQFGLTLPLAVGVAALAALVPAHTAARGTTVSVIAPTRDVRRSRVPASSLTLAVRDLWGTWRVEAILGASAVALGAALLGGVVLIAQAFRGQLDTTVLGLYLAAQVQLFHLVLAVLALSIGALAATEIVTLSYLERQPQLAALRALGWPRVRVLQILAGQAIALGLCGGGIAALLVYLGGWLVRAPPEAIAASAAASCLGALLATMGAVCGPLLSAYRLSPAAALREE